MSAVRNSPADFAARLYARIPGHYRVYDEEQGRPLLALVAVIANRVADLRANLDELWDDFFIETCADWVVPYIGALVGTNLLPQPVGQSDRLDVWNTVAWRRNKGTLAILTELSNDISGWPASLDEFYASLGWAQNLNHLRLTRSLTVNVRDALSLAALGGAFDSFAHAVDTRVGSPLDAAPSTLGSRGLPTMSLGTRGRYNLGQLGVFTNRLATFAIVGATPAGAAPTAAQVPNQRWFTFDPLFREMPLFAASDGSPISRAAFGAAPWSFAENLAVRSFGVALYTNVAPAQSAHTDGVAFTFESRALPFTLDAQSGLTLLGWGGKPATPFIIEAEWYDPTGANLLAALGHLDASSAPLDGGKFTAGATATSPGRLAIRISCAPRFRGGRFSDGILAVRAAQSGVLRDGDGAFVTLPGVYVAPGASALFWVDAQGATYTSPALAPAGLASPGIGSAYPPSAQTPSTTGAAFARLHRLLGLRVVDPSRFGGTVVQIVAAANGDFAHSRGSLTSPTAAYQATAAALAGNVPGSKTDVLTLRYSGNGPLPPCEVIATDRSGNALLVYLPAVAAQAGTATADFIVAQDGSTYTSAPGTPQWNDLGGMALARSAAGQVLPIAGVWPLRQRRAVGIDTRRVEPRFGEVAIDPPAGRFRLAFGDPLVGVGSSLSVDYVTAFTGSVGALGDTSASPEVWSPSATRFVASSGDCDAPQVDNLPSAPLHRTVANAFANAQPNDVIEIVDSSTYAEAQAPTLTLAAASSVVLRAAAGLRPTIVRSALVGTEALSIQSDRCTLELAGLLFWGGTLAIQGHGCTVRVFACAFDPDAGGPSILATNADLSAQGTMSLTASIVGPIVAAAGIATIAAKDCVIGRFGDVAISGPALVRVAPSSPIGPTPNAPRFAGTLQIDSTTLLGSIVVGRLIATDALLQDNADVAERIYGCIRYSRYSDGSLLPPAFRCTPASVSFWSHHFDRVTYARLAPGTASEVSTAAESGAEPGAFATRLDALRLGNLQTKLREFMPVNVTPVVIALT